MKLMLIYYKSLHQTAHETTHTADIWYIWKKRSEETQTLRTGCSKAEPKSFHPAANPIPGGAGWPKFNQLAMGTTFTYKPS